jgi:hypothetical protein
MLFSVIQGNHELNKAYIIEHFCINKDKPELKCEGKCYLMQQMKAEKEKQDAQAVHKFHLDFGIFIPTKKIQPFGLLVIHSVETTLCGYSESKYTIPFFEKFLPPKV